MNTKGLTEDVKQLKELKHKLSERDESFAHNLIQYFESKGFLTSKQMPYIGELLERANRVAATQSTEIEEVFNGHSLRTLLFAARQNLKYPSLKLQDDKIGTIRFYIAGALSKTPGYIIIDNGKTPPNKVVYGTIESSGTGNLRRTAAIEIKTFIRRIASNPIKEAKLCGIKFSHCCFCGIMLTSPTSLYHGYGPICADNWGLPWEGPKLLEDKEAEQKHIQLVDLGEST